MNYDKDELNKTIADSRIDDGQDTRAGLTGLRHRIAVCDFTMRQQSAIEVSGGRSLLITRVSRPGRQQTVRNRSATAGNIEVAATSTAARVAAGHRQIGYERIRVLQNENAAIRGLHRIGDYDICPCIGQHVESTKEIGTFKITSTSYNDGSFRIVFKVNTDKK